MRFLALCLWAAIVCPAAADDPPAAEAPDLSVLMPSMEGQFVVGVQYNLNAAYPLVGMPGDVADRARTRKLRELVRSDRYDPARALVDRLVDALNEAGYRAVLEPIARRPAGSLQPLSWTDLPERPAGKLTLDVNIRWVCLCASISYAKVFPAISLGWRLLDPVRQEVVEPTHNLVYYHIPWNPPDRRDDTEKPRAAPPYPPVTVTESCGYFSLDRVKDNPAALWGCFGEALDVAVERLVIDIAATRRLPGHPGAPAPAPPG